MHPTPIKGRKWTSCNIYARSWAGDFMLTLPPKKLVQRLETLRGRGDVLKMCLKYFNMLKNCDSPFHRCDHTHFISALTPEYSLTQPRTRCNTCTELGVQRSGAEPLCTVRSRPGMAEQGDGTGLCNGRVRVLREEG